MTDRQVYEWFFKRHDKEAEAEERIRRMTAAEEAKPADRQRDEFSAMCRDFGFSEAQAEAAWAAWLKEG